MPFLRLPGNSDVYKSIRINTDYIVTVQESTNGESLTFWLADGTSCHYHTEKQGLSAFESLWENHGVDLAETH